MQELSESQKARLAIREFKTITDSIAIRGYYRPMGRIGKTLENCLRDLSPEIYGSMNDSRVVELKGLEYVIDRLPRGIETCFKLILTDEDQFDDSPFEEIVPLKRRRTSYKISEKEVCFIISRGISEVYDIFTHLMFLNIEAKKIFRGMQDEFGNIRVEWRALEKVVERKDELDAAELDSALWNLSIILGRPYHETRETYEYLDRGRREHNSNHGLFSLIYSLGKRIEKEKKSKDDALVIYVTPSLMSIIGHHRYGKTWAHNIKKKLAEEGMMDRPLHIVSANLHSMVNIIYGYAVMKEKKIGVDENDFYTTLPILRNKGEEILSFARERGFYLLPDSTGANIDCQIIDTAKIVDIPFHPALGIDGDAFREKAPIILIMDYAFGAQAFELMEKLLGPHLVEENSYPINLGSISIMGKAGTLCGDKGDIMLATAHVCEGSSDNYIFENDLAMEDFDGDIPVHIGPMATVLGTSLQNRNVLKMFRADWDAVGLEMEGGHYHKAVNAAIIKKNIPRNSRVRYAYYASDNPMMTGNTLAAGSMGNEGIKPAYMITKAILKKIIK